MGGDWRPVRVLAGGPGSALNPLPKDGDIDKESQSLGIDVHGNTESDKVTNVNRVGKSQHADMQGMMRPHLTSSVAKLAVEWLVIQHASKR